jgi:hypothetical protein
MLIINEKNSVIFKMIGFLLFKNYCTGAKI